MSTQFPTGLDSFVNPQASDTMAAVPHHAQHANANDAIAALEAKVGVTGSAVPQSLDYRVGALAAVTQVTETPAGTLDGVNAAFTLSRAPAAGTLLVSYNGLVQRAGAGNDFTISGSTLTFANAPEAAAVLVAHYAA